MRKIRWKAFGSGKSGGVRVVYYWIVQKDVILLLDVFSKNEKENLSRSELSELVKIKNEAVKDYE
jgi:mRNA-degrading endonuclease RelE of RelBE toxin-antitoxin system